jgi:hypothetical protein
VRLSPIDSPFSPTSAGDVTVFSIARERQKISISRAAAETTCYGEKLSALHA